MGATGVGLGHKECCDCYKDRLRTNGDAVVAIGLAVDTQSGMTLHELAEHHKGGFCGNWGRLRTQYTMVATGLAEPHRDAVVVA